MNKMLACAVFSTSFLLAGTAKADTYTNPFPAAGIDSVYSMGRFGINVDPTFIKNDVSFYTDLLPKLQSEGFTWAVTDDETKETKVVQTNEDKTKIEATNKDKDAEIYTLWSPVLFDNNTQIIHGAPYSSTIGGPVNRVDTQILTFDMTNGPISLVAGISAISAPASLGVVESNTPQGGFNATSSFNVYVNATIGISDDYLYNPNGSPLKIVNNSISSFPPNVVYLHESSANQVPIYLHTGPYDFLFGNLFVAGHGVTTAPEKLADRQDNLHDYLASLPKDDPARLVYAAVASIPEPEEWAMMLVGAAMVSYQVKRKTAKQKSLNIA